MTTAKLPAGMVERAALATLSTRQERGRYGDNNVDAGTTKAVRLIGNLAALARVNTSPDDRMIALTLEQFGLIADGFTYPEPLEVKPAQEPATRPEERGTR